MEVSFVSMVSYFPSSGRLSELNPKPAPFHSAELLQLLPGVFDNVRGYGQSNPRSSARASVVTSDHPDDFTLQVEQRGAIVSGLNTRKLGKKMREWSRCSPQCRYDSGKDGTS